MREFQNRLRSWLTQQRRNITKHADSLAKNWSFLNAFAAQPVLWWSLVLVVFQQPLPSSFYFNSLDVFRRNQVLP